MASPTNVSTPMEFVSAVEAGVLDIVVTNHLDFTLLPLPLKCARPHALCSVANPCTRRALTQHRVCRAFISCDDGCDSPVGGINTTRSIRVCVIRCQTSSLCVSLWQLPWPLPMQRHVETCSLLQLFG